MGRIALVTGATSRIGQSIVRRLVENGIDCALTARRGELLTEVAGAYANYGVSVISIPGDIGQEDDVRAIVERTRTELGDPDILVHVAAGSAIKPVLEFTGEDWRSDFAVNVDAAFLLAQLLAPGMRDKGRGRIVTIGSVFASLSANPWFYEGRWPTDHPGGPVRNAAYTPSKGALRMLTRDLAAMFGPWGITANMVSPGMMKVDRPIEPELVRRYEQMTPVGRMGHPDDIANAVAFLAGEDAGFITGHDLVVDGGWSIW